MEEGKCFTPSLPKLKGYKPSYYATHDEAFPATHVMLERSASRLGSDSKFSVSFRDLSKNESIARQSLSIPNYQEWVLSALVQSVTFRQTSLILKRTSCPSRCAGWFRSRHSFSLA